MPGTLPDLQGPDDPIHEALVRLMDMLYEPLAQGVEGFTKPLTDGGIELAGIRVSEGHEGTGAVGRYLDSLPKDRTVLVPFVISKRLEGMLVRRSFVCIEPAPRNTWIRTAS